MKLYNDAGIETANLPNSVKASMPWGGVSSKYAFASSLEVAETIRKELNYIPVYAQEARTRIEGKGSYTKHMLRFRAVNSLPVLNGLHFEIVLINSHDRASSLSLSLGIYRMVCSNGLCLGGDIFSTGAMHHTGNGLKGLGDKIAGLISKQGMVADTVNTMQHRMLSLEDRMAFARQAVTLRYPKLTEDENQLMAVRTLQTRRYQDAGQDVFSVYNVVQENLLAGGMRGISGRRIRQVNSIDSAVKVNEGLWELAASYV